MQLTHGQISFLLFLFGFVVIGSAAVLWNLYIPPARIKTPDERRLDSYYDCVKRKLSTQYSDAAGRTQVGNPVDCDVIK